MMNQPTNTLYNATIASPIASNVVISISYLLLSNSLNLTHPTDNFCQIGRVVGKHLVNNNPQPYPHVIHNPQVIHRYLSTSYPQAVDKKIRRPVFHRLSTGLRLWLKTQWKFTGYPQVIHMLSTELYTGCW